jgi:hypothetical protein
MTVVRIAILPWWFLVSENSTRPSGRAPLVARL